MKHIILIGFACIQALANEFTCSVSPNKSLKSQIEGCKLEILRHECEKQGVKLVSSSTTNNYTLTNDKISSYALCRNLKFTVQTAVMNESHDKIKVQYVMEGNPMAAEEISYQNWVDLGSAQTKTNATLGATQREDSTVVLNLSANVQIDSRQVKENLNNVKNQTLLAIKYLAEQYNEK